MAFYSLYFISIYYIVYDVFYPRNDILQDLTNWPQRKLQIVIHKII